MLDTLTHENFRDFSQRYQGTYGWLVGDDKNKVLVYIRKVTEDRVVFMDVTAREFHANAGQDVQFEFLPVTRGWFYNEEGEMVLLSRRAARQWHRGICMANTNMAVVRKNRLYAIEYNLKQLKSVFEPTKKYPYQAAQNSIWSKQFATVDGVLYLYDKPIGKFDPANKVVVLDKIGEFLRQEIMDVINRNNFGVDVR